MEFFDSHAHYNDEKFDEDREEILKKITKAGITKAIISGYNISSSKMAIEIVKEREGLFATCGISPNDAMGELSIDINEIEKLCKMSKKVVAIGEIGLDYHWNKENKEVQQKYFKGQIAVANKLNLPIVIHSRDAYIDTIKILKENPCKRKGVFHCCQLNMELIKSALELGYYISLAGVCTFKNAKSANEIIKQIPLERLIIETDSPYLSPEPLRGTRNDSRNIKLIAEKISAVKQIPIEEIAKITYKNAEELFL